MLGMKIDNARQDYRKVMQDKGLFPDGPKALPGRRTMVLGKVIDNCYYYEGQWKIPHKTIGDARKYKAQITMS